MVFLLSASMSSMIFWKLFKMLLSVSQLSLLQQSTINQIFSEGINSTFMLYSCYQLSIATTSSSESALVCFLKFLLSLSSLCSNDSVLLIKLQANVWEEMMVITRTLIRFRRMYPERDAMILEKLSLLMPLTMMSALLQPMASNRCSVTKLIIYFSASSISLMKLRFFVFQFLLSWRWFTSK